ncbi:hypothetical protein AAVH_20588 [Aphelenchoides avenae]|nr:hypothetical protein AAVH_20588 [Aphelenchus avenae]
MPTRKNTSADAGPSASRARVDEPAPTAPLATQAGAAELAAWLPETRVMITTTTRVEFRCVEDAIAYEKAMRNKQ